MAEGTKLYWEGVVDSRPYLPGGTSPDFLLADISAGVVFPFGKEGGDNFLCEVVGALRPDPGILTNKSQNSG